ncbi:MAG: transcriptional repressor [Methylobacteriaceae bacterium]|nr:transcriptional repressor [Methylobacteriaceae bacterium]
MTSSHRHGPDATETGLTPLRRQVLEALRSEGRPLGAYDIIARLGAGGGRSLAPVSVYRALDHLLKQGLAHRLASRNAYIACGHGHCAGESVAFLICEACGAVAEATSPSLKGDLATLAASAGFAARNETIEILGRCAACRAGPGG